MLMTMYQLVQREIASSLTLLAMTNCGAFAVIASEAKQSQIPIIKGLSV
jgi:hypothetical protein